MLLEDGQELDFGNLKMKVLMYIPGHTPVCVSLVVGDAIFTGDTLFIPDMGTAQCDFQLDLSKIYTTVSNDCTGFPTTLVYSSVMTMLQVVVSMRGKPPWWFQRVQQKQIKAGTPLEEFSEFYVQGSWCHQKWLFRGALPPKEDNGISYLKLPLNLLGKDDHA